MTNEQIDKQLTRAQNHADKELARDLVLCISNDGDLYRQTIDPNIKNLRRWIARGKFDPKQAIAAMYNVIETALSNARFERYTSYNKRLVDVPTRWGAAVLLLDEYSELISEVK